MAAAQFNCTLCERFASPDFGGLLRHIGNEHAFDHNFIVQYADLMDARELTKTFLHGDHIYTELTNRLLHLSLMVVTKTMKNILQKHLNHPTV